MWKQSEKVVTWTWDYIFSLSSSLGLEQAARHWKVRMRSTSTPLMSRISLMLSRTLSPRRIQFLRWEVICWHQYDIFDNEYYGNVMFNIIAMIATIMHLSFSVVPEPLLPSPQVLSTSNAFSSGWNTSVSTSVNVDIYKFGQYIHFKRWQWIDLWVDIKINAQTKWCQFDNHHMCSLVSQPICSWHPDTCQQGNLTKTKSMVIVIWGIQRLAHNHRFKTHIWTLGILGCWLQIRRAIQSR